MKVTDVVQKLELEMEESQNQRDKRVEELWRQLDPQGTGELDLKGLQKGLRRIDHRQPPYIVVDDAVDADDAAALKNASDMLQDIVDMVDTSGDGKIQYEEFRTFVEAAERQLLLLFRSIDRDHDGRVGMEELGAAFKRSGLAVPKRRLAGFFNEIDENHDGFISFDEWRDFLLFMPTHENGSPLEAALSFYSSIVTLNAEGDSNVTEETLEGLGTTGFLLQALFGSILKLAQPQPPLYPPPSTTPSDQPHANGASPAPPSEPQQQQEQPPREPAERAPPTSPSSSSPSSSRDADPSETNANMAVASAQVDCISLRQATETAVKSIMGAAFDDDDHGGQQAQSIHDHPLPFFEARENIETSKTKLTQYLPEPGYFVAGAIAGGISRTATAPLDRLKVYLLVNTQARTDAAIQAAKHGHPLAALRNAGQPVNSAVRELWKAGGFRTFFTGNGLNVVKIMPETAIKFGSYEAAKRTLATLEGHGDPTQINPYSKFVAGGLAGMIAQFAVYPLDTLKFRLQCETFKGGLTGNALLAQTARKMVADGGFRSAYRGLTMGLVGMFPYSAIDMGTFELLKNTYMRYKAKHYGIHEEDAAPGNFATGVIGATSGAFGATVVYPLNVLRTRLQTQGTVMHPPTYTGIWDVAQRTLRNEGFRGMYKGLTPNLLKVAPALSITWVVYENSKRLLGLN